MESWSTPVLNEETDELPKSTPQTGKQPHVIIDLEEENEKRSQKNQGYLLSKNNIPCLPMARDNFLYSPRAKGDNIVYSQPAQSSPPAQSDSLEKYLFGI